MSTDWSEFPHDSTAFEYQGDALFDNWGLLHSGDCEPFPDADYLQQLIDETASDLGDGSHAAEILQDAWRHYHAGRFALAVQLGEQLGPLGATVANKAAAIYADYLEEDESTQLAIYEETAQRAQEAIEVLPNLANAHYFHAMALGRYSQGISIAKALAQGFGGRIKKSLERALELEPEHAEALTAMGLYHAEVIDKVGSLMGGLTYGANSKEALQLFAAALELTPDAPIAHIEYANGLLMLNGNKSLEQATEEYEVASELTPIDAMQSLDIEMARGEFEE